ncbi:Y-family DNA polymerase [Microbulbifer aggregans]|uniref:Y-family DNA polymerase n=1 Tax=Microbulbifer aggregans TaxID=1769779 RepID=UPI001CFF27BF|nr:Y-family DNA polymerase [Microbulbifer aggregans]
MNRWDYNGKQVALVDVNNFYVSCERAFNPTIRKKAVCVVSNNDGCVIARSAEVKAMGIKMGTPLFQIRGLLASRGVEVRSSNYTLYHDMSERFIDCLEQFCPSVEQYSIDESFLHFEGFGSGLDAHCQRLIAAVRQCTSLPCCAGIAPTRTLAKAANHFAKTLGVPGGVLQITDEYHRQQILQQLPVTEVWGVGSRLSKRLACLGITTAWDLSASHIPTMRKAFGVVMERTVRELQGIPSVDLAPMDKPKDEIMSGRTFGSKVSSYTGLMASLANHVTLACEKLRAQNGATGRVTISIQPTRQGDYSSPSVSAYSEVRPATDDPQTILAVVRQCLGEIYREGKTYRRASVMLSSIETANKTQSDLFGLATEDRSGINHCLEAINQRFGRGAVTFAATKLSKDWEMKREYLSPSYTTNVKDLPIAKIS